MKPELDTLPAAIPIAAADNNEHACRTQHRNAALIPVDKIRPDPDQPRKSFDQPQLNQLAESLKTRGQLQPIRVRWDDEHASYIILMGERRWRAAGIAGLAELECVIHDKSLSESENLEIQLIENALREDLNPLDHGIALKHLLQSNGYTASQLANSLKESRRKVSRLVDLANDFPEEAGPLLRSGQLNATTAEVIITNADEDSRLAFCQKAAAGKWTAKQALQHIRQHSAGQGGAVVKPLTFTLKSESCEITVKAIDGPSILHGVYKAVQQLGKDINVVLLKVENATVETMIDFLDHKRAQEDAAAKSEAASRAIDSFLTKSKATA